MIPLPFGTAENDAGDFYITYQGEAYALMGDRSWTNLVAAQGQVLELNQIWLEGFKAGAGFALDTMEATK